MNRAGIVLRRMWKRPVTVLAITTTLGVWVYAQGQSADTPVPLAIPGAYLSAPVGPGVFIGDLRDLSQVAPWQPGDPTVEGPARRVTHPQALSPLPEYPGQRDPLLDLQQGVAPVPGSSDALARSSAPSFTKPILNRRGQNFTGVWPPDTVGEVGVINQSRK